METFSAFMDSIVGKLGEEAQLRRNGGPPLAAPALAEHDEVMSIEVVNINPARALEESRLANPIIGEDEQEGVENIDDDDDEEGAEEEEEEEDSDDIVEIAAFIRNN